MTKIRISFTNQPVLIIIYLKSEFLNCPLGPLESCHKCVKSHKKSLSRFTGLGPHLTDVYLRLYWQNSGLVRKYEKKSKSKKAPPLNSNNLDDQLNHHLALCGDDELIDYFINGGEVDSDDE
jgi:hypothetical protein